MSRKVAPAASKQLLAEFDAYGPEVRKAALDHFGKSIEEIEGILGKSSPDEGLRDDLAGALWKYARGKARQDGSLPELPSQVHRYIKLLDTTARGLRDALARFVGDAQPVDDDDVSLLGARVRVEQAEHGKSYEEANWAKLSPMFRAAHNRLRQARGMEPILDPEVDLYAKPPPVPVRKIKELEPNSKETGGAQPFDAAADTVVIMLRAAGIDAHKVLEQLEAILSVTENAACKSGSGRPPDIEYGILMDRVIDIFQLELWQRATLTSDRIKHRFSGAFFRVAELVDVAAASATQQPPRTNSALGELLKRHLRHGTQRSLKGQNPG
jgi:hypothetical protein